MSETQVAPEFPPQKGEMADLIRRFDWAGTPLGPIGNWPPHLKAAVSLILCSGVPMNLLWGSQGVMVYNDGYRQFAGGRHPNSLGQPVIEAWPEVAAFNSNILDVVLAKGETLAYRDQPLVLARNGAPEEVWLNLDYSRIVDERGAPAGVLAIVKETTERVRVEQRLRIAQEAGGVGIFEWYPATGKLDVSSEYRRIWGLDPDVAVTDQMLVGLLHPDDRRNAAPAKLDQPNPLAYAEYRRIDPKTGEARWIARRGEAVSSPEIGSRRFVGIATDITDRKVAEQKLRESEARWRGLFEQMHEGFFTGEVVRDANGRVRDFVFVDVNPAFHMQTGIPAGEAAGRPVREVIPGIQDEVIDIYARVVETGESVEFEILVPALADRWFEARARPNGPEQFAVLFLDISQRKLAEQAILESETRFRMLAQSMPNHVWAAKADGQLEWLNDRVYAYSGMAHGSLDREAWAATIHPDDARTTVGVWVEARERGQPYEAELRVRRQDGAYRWHIARAVPIHDASGAVERWIGTSTDIEDRKAAEAAMADLASTLEQHVEARTAELLTTQEALRQSQKMEALGKLTGGVAHDFNNLLQVVSGNLQLLAKDIAGNERAERRAANALAGVSRGAKLANQLLAFGRRQALEPKVVNIGRFVSGMDDMLRRALGESIDVETVISGGLWNTFVDPAQIENALLNLAINSRDAMDGVGRLTIELGNAYLDDAYARTHAEVAPGQYVMLAVTDTGTGMQPELIPQVFEPFFSTKPEGKGTGLGLSMVYGFVKQSGGHVKIYSEVGQGTTVKLYLPRADQSEDVVLAPDVGPVTGGTETVLVAEDDDEVRATVVEMLSDLGYRVLKARDAATALTVIESGVAIDLLFTDVVMPGPLRSPELARKARERLPDIAVLFTSGYTENAIVHGGRLDPGVELLGKPYTREALARKLRHVLANRAQRQVPRPAAPAPEPRRASDTLKLTVLLVEDDVVIRSVTTEFLQDLGHVVVATGSAEAAKAALENTPVDVLITDVGLPGISGAAFAEQARRLRPELGVVFATGSHHHPTLTGGGPPAAVLRKPYDSAGIAAALKAVKPRGT
jgi:PAS domain S-box-containing protein